ncbi:MAG: serine hydrolase [Gordonia paraffinivorans]
MTTMGVTRFAVVLCALGLIAGCTASAPDEPSLSTTPQPSRAARPTPAADQLRWFVGASARMPLSDGDLRDHFAESTYRDFGGSPRAVAERLAPFAGLRLDRLGPSRSPSAQSAVVATSAGTQLVMTVGLDRDGRMATLLFAPRPQAPTSWAAVDLQLASLAPQASFAIDRVDGDRCVPVHQVAGDTQRPLGSAFKLYVLGALGHAVDTGRVSWDDTVTVRDDWKSLPSGQLQDSPAGTPITYRRLADLMISISDNTAADHLIHMLGRDSVQAMLTRFANADPSKTTPFLTTRDLFVLKTSDYPVLAQRYLAATTAQRGAMVDVLDRTSFGDWQRWTTPRDVDTIEWFGSPRDMCRAMTGLAEEASRPSGAPIADALSINDGNLLLDPSQYPTVWFKGGSEPGVLTLNYRIRARDGATYVASAMLANPGAALDENLVAPTAQAVIRGALELAQR